MGQHNDDKMGATGPTINDMEPPYVAGLWAPVTPRPVTVEAWMDYWDSLTVDPGHFNDRAAIWLKNEGHGGNLTDQWASYWAGQLSPTLPAEGGIMGSGQRLFEFAALSGPTLQWVLTGTNATINAAAPGGNCVLAEGAVGPHVDSSNNFGLWPAGAVYTALWNVEAAVGAALLYNIQIPNGGQTGFQPPTTGPFFAVSGADETAAATGRAILSNVVGNSVTLNFFDWFLGDKSVEFLGLGYTQVPWS